MIRESDIFVILDNVNFQKKGFINRNLIKSYKSEQAFTVPLSKASQNKKIYEISTFNWPEFRSDLRNKICQTLKLSPNFDEALYLFDQVAVLNTTSLLELNKATLEVVCAKFEINSDIVLASEVSNTSSKGQQLILDICEELSATEYINLPGGKNLYSKDKFWRHGVELKFMNQSCLKLPVELEFLRFSSILSAVAYGLKV